MNPLWILLTGMAVVVAGVLALRLHAFLALIAGALVVAALTPASYVYRFSLRSGMMEVVGVSEQERVLTLKAKGKLAEGTPLVLLRRADTATGYTGIATLRVLGGDAAAGQVRAEIVADTPALLPEAGDVAVEPAAESAARKAAHGTIGERIAEGFGRTALDIGILIAMAAIVGETLLGSGAAERIVMSSRRALGDRHVAIAFLVSGYVLGIPVFFDTVFYLLIPLGKVMRLRSGRDYPLYVMSIVAGATMTHSLVPPTPGPLLIASELKVNLATMIVAGLIVGAFTATAGYLYALWANHRWDIPLRATAGLSEAELKEIEQRDEATLPPLWLSLTPILLPVVLITLSAVADAFRPKEGYEGLRGVMAPALKTLGEKNVALVLSAVIGLFMLASSQRKRASAGATSGAGAKSTSALVGEALASAGVIILITSAGGAFGYVLRQTDIATTLKQTLPISTLALLPLAFLVTAAVRTAQGSATVAMITAAGIVSPIAAAGGLPFHPVYLALAIGCGSKPIMWMNDSGFWIIGKMSGFTETETLKTASAMMIVMAVTGLLVTMLGAWWFPMV